MTSLLMMMSFFTSVEEPRQSVTVCCPAGRGDIQPQLDSAVQDVTDKYLLLEETEKQAVRKVLTEERARFCVFVSMLRPVVVRRFYRMLHSALDVFLCPCFNARLCVSGRGDRHAGGDRPSSDYRRGPQDSDCGPAQTAPRQRTGQSPARR